MAWMERKKTWWTRTRDDHGGPGHEIITQPPRYEIIMVDPMHKVIRDCPRINWICNPAHKHRELRGLTSAGRKGRSLHRRGKAATKVRPSVRASWRRRNMMQLRRYR